MFYVIVGSRLADEEKRLASKHLMTFSVKLYPRILFAKSAEPSYGDWPRMLCLPMAHCPSSPQAFGLAAREDKTEGCFAI